MPEVVTVAKVMGSSEPWQDSYGNSNVDWSIELTDGRKVTRGMREGKAGPNEGDQWEVESWEQKDNFPPKAKGVKFISGNGSAPSQGRSSTSSQPQGEWDPYHPRQRLIVRQSAIKAAVEILTSHAPLQEGVYTERTLEEWIDWFERKTWEAVSGKPGESSKVIAAPQDGAGATSGYTDTEAKAKVGGSAEGDRAQAQPQGSVSASDGVAAADHMPPSAESSGNGSGPTTAVEVREHLQGLGIANHLVNTKIKSFNGAKRLEDLTAEQLVIVANWGEEVIKHDGEIPF